MTRTVGIGLASNFCDKEEYPDSGYCKPNYDIIIYIFIHVVYAEVDALV